MKKSLKYIAVLIIILTPLFFISAAPEKSNMLDAVTAAGDEFYMYIYNHLFIHETPASGIYTADIKGEGAMRTFKGSSGFFEAFPVDRVNVIIVSETSTVRGQLHARIFAIGLVNLYKGTYESLSAELILTDMRTGKVRSTTDLYSTGTLDPTDFSTLELEIFGSF